MQLLTWLENIYSYYILNPQYGQQQIVFLSTLTNPEETILEYLKETPLKKLPENLYGNPGWVITIRNHPQLFFEHFPECLIEDSGGCDWLVLTRDSTFSYGYSGPGNLCKLFSVLHKNFLDTCNNSTMEFNDCVSWLDSYYIECCNGFWEYFYGITLKTVEGKGWHLQIDLDELTLADGIFDPISIQRSDTDWVTCEVSRKKFLGRGGPRNLREIIQIFKKWVEDFDATYAQE